MDSKYLFIKLVSGENIMALVDIADEYAITLTYPVQVEDKTENAWDYLLYCDDKTVTISTEYVLFTRPLSSYAENRYKEIVDKIKNTEDFPAILTEEDTFIDSRLQ